MKWVFVSTFSALALAPCALLAERINPATDLLKHEVPASRLSVAGGSTSGRYGGDTDNVWGIFNDNDSNTTMFYKSMIEDPGCYVDVTIGLHQTFNPNDCLNTYAIRVAKNSQYMSVNRAPKTWQGWGKTDEEGADWVLLDTENDQTGWQFADNGGLEEGTVGAAASPGETRYYHFANGGVPYKYLRFRFLDNNGDGTYVAVTQIILYSLATPASGASAETFAGCADLVPASTSATASRYTTTTHAAPSSFGAGNATEPFSDKDPARVLMKLEVNDTADLIYEFGTDNKTIVNGYMLRFTDHQYTTPSRAPLTWTLSGSDDNEHWTVVDSRTDQVSWEKGEKRYYLFENHTAYAYYRILFTRNNGASDYYEFGNIDYYYLPQTGVFFSGLDSSLDGGVLTVSGAIAMDSLAANVSIAFVTNGVRAVQDFGTLQPGGTFSASIPVSQGTLCGTLTGVSADGAYTNSVVSGPFYIPGAASVRFVSPNGLDSAAGTSLETPMRRIATAVASLGAEGGTVFVLPGEYSETNDLSAVELTNSVSVIGVTGDPADVIVTRSAKYARVFKLANPSALVRSLTMQGGNVQNEPVGDHTAAEANASANPGSSIAVGVNGGNLWISEAGGVVENCVIRDGKASRYAVAGGNAYMKGGRLSRCILTGGNVSNSHDISSECGTSLLAEGNSIVENCLFTGTTIHRVPVCVGGSAKMLNCTVVGNSGTNCGGILIKGNNSRVLNTVVFGNTTTNTATVAHSAVYLASKKNGSIPTDASAAFVKCASDGAAINGSCLLVGASAFADAANGDYAPASKESPLVNKGVDYATNGGVSNLDLAGNPRVWTRTPDIGAFEFLYEVQAGTVVLFR